MVPAYFLIKKNFMSILCPQIYSEGTLLENYDKKMKNQTISNENGVGAVSSPGYLARSFPRTSPFLPSST